MSDVVRASSRPRVPSGAAPQGRASGEIRLWSVSLGDVPLPVDEGILSSREIARAARYRRRARRRFVARRVFLRRALGAHLGIPPGAVELRPGARGKPALVSPGGRRPPDFNLSHSRGLALLAVAPRGPVGVDVERLRRIPDAEEIARRFFAPVEAEAVLAAEEEERMRSFLALWTLKEAVLKALGCGLSMPLDSFAVRATPGGSATLAWRHGEEGRGEVGWSLRRLAPGDGWVGALAVPRTEIEVRLGHWPPRAHPTLGGRPSVSPTTGPSRSGG